MPQARLISQNRWKMAMASLLDSAGRRLRRAAQALRLTEGAPDASELRKRWETWVDSIQLDVAELQDHRQNWQLLAEALDANPGIPQPNYVADWVRELYGIVVAVGIRAQADRRHDVVTLARLMDDIARHPDALTRAWYVQKYPEHIKDVGHSTFDDFAGPGGQHVNPEFVRKDLDRLRSIAKKVSDYVNKHVAHRAEEQHVEFPTYNDLIAALDTFDELLRRYYLMVDGSGLVSTTPAKSYPFLRPLIVPWAPDDRLLRILREAGHLPHDPDDPERHARAALRQHDLPDERVIEGLLAIIDRLRAELGEPS